MKFGKTFPNHQVPEWSHEYVSYKSLKKLIKEIVAVQDQLYKQEHGVGGKNGETPSNSPPMKPMDPTTRTQDYLNHKDVKSVLAKFFFALDADIQKVDSFYNKQFLEYDRRLRKLLSSAQFTDFNRALMYDNGNGIDGYTHNAGNGNGYLYQPMPTSFNHHQSLTQYGQNPYQVNQNPVNHPTLSSNHATDEAEDWAEVLAILIELRSHFRNLKWYGELNKRAFTKILKKLDKKVGTSQQQPITQARIAPLEFSNDTEINRNLHAINKLLNTIFPKVKSSHNEPNGVSNGSNGSLGDPNSPVDIFSELIARDDGEGLMNELISVYRSAVLIPTRTLVGLLNKSALSQSYKCIDEILSIIPTLGDPTDISSRNFFHHHVIALGKSHKQMVEKTDKSHVGLNSLMTKSLEIEAALPPVPNNRLIGAFGSDGVNSNDSPSSLQFILQKLPVHLRPSLLQKDNYKRTPLHYSAQYGLVEVSKIIIESLIEWGAWNSNTPVDDVQVWGDSEGLTPIHLAVIGTHPMTLGILTSHLGPETKLNTPRLLHLATRLNSPDLMDALLSIPGFEINYRDPDQLETALYLACKLNLKNVVEHLLSRGADMEIGEKLFGWTPIFVAATEGLTDIVKILKKHGAKYDILDESGWSPMEHAALRGHLEITDLLRIQGNKDITHPKFVTDWNIKDDSSINNIKRESSPRPEFYKQGTTTSSSIDIMSEGKPTNNSRKMLTHSLSSGRVTTSKDTCQQESETVKKFGHSHLNSDESIVLISLGSNDTRSTKTAVQLNKVPVNKVSSTELDTALSLVVSCPDSLFDDTFVIDLPFDSNSDTISFKVPYKPDSSHRIFFDIVPTYGYSSSSRSSSPGINNPSHSEKGIGRSGRQHQQYREHSRFPGHPNAMSPVSMLHANISSPGPASNSFSSPPKPKILGRAVALLDTALTSVGTKMSSLYETVTIPILGIENLDVLGTVNFEFMNVTPFDHPHMGLAKSEKYWKSLVSTRVIGHRGLGKNFNTKKSLQLGENTVESFIAAASLGASYVEFDVQLTKDHIPVVYHDFLVAESGVDIPMHSLTLEQFMDLNSADKHHVSHSSGNGVRRSLDDTDAAILRRSRMPKDSNISMKYGKNQTKDVVNDNSSEESKSVSNTELESNAKAQAETRDRYENGNDISRVFEDRMRLTKTFKKNAFKGNSRGHSIASNFVTLKELFKKIPESVGFNVECKYPMLDEAENEDMGTVVLDIGHWVDTVLKVVFDNANGRDIIFSSFNPNVCVMLSLKQPSIPILFLTEAGTTRMADIRATSLQNAIRFAKSWNLLGIVSAAQPIVKAPRLAQVVKSSGLVCVTYGVENNDPENARIEMDAGVDAVIVDSVLAVRKGLTRDNNKK
ncbi:unnamed protein product [Kluyveromyces dobzhanskii CBS 2104]|uniref:WGS project CCBQ000000000 data, contig 00272 n=1 Tax=Kluyveromyces dobzhanskii CBS 2104 TaxID=1427455 RepID=A0A0A8LAR6_9SACH|nr:unnamed protein product [Kluyveromyces dobzhanskii CBS 2104]